MNRDINICLIGAGRAGMIHANNFKNIISNAKLSVIVESSKNTREDACKILGINESYEDYKKILTNNHIDAVIVAVPTKFHRDIVIDCAKAKKNILCEKPMAMTVNDCEEMIKACSDNNVLLQIGFMRRFDSSFIEAKQAIQEGLIGEIVQIRSITRGPNKPREWMYDIQKSNGALAEVNSHDIDCVRWLADSEFDSVYAIAGNFRNKSVAKEYPDFYDNVVLTAKLKNCIQVTIEGAQYVKYGYDARVEVLGTEGILYIGRSNANNIKIIKNNQIKVPFVNSWLDLFKNAYVNEDQHFVNCIINKKVPDITGIDGKMAVRVIEAGNKSIKTGEIIYL